eukprot:1091414-Prymnesium_polylepis.1
MSTSGVKYVRANRDGWVAQVSVGGVNTPGPTRRTIDEAAADAIPLLEEQRRAKIARRQQQASDEAAVRADHAEKLQANTERSGDNKKKDGLSRAFVKLALEGTSTVAVDGV